MNRPNIPPPTNEDRLPDNRAVWRDPPCPASAPKWLSITVEYPGGMIERTTVEYAAWSVVQRWRFGHAPRDDQKGQAA